MADEPSSPQPSPGFGQSRYQLGPDDTPTIPNLFAQGDPPPGFWDAPRQPDDSARQDSARQGVAGSPAAASGAGAAAGAAGPGPQVVPPPDDAGLGVQVASTLPPPAERRRGALIAVGLVALATVLVVAAALLIGPHLGSGGTDDDNQQAAPPLTPASTSRTTSSDGGTAPETSLAVAPPPADPTGQSGAGGSSDAAAPSTGAGTTSGSVVTVTVTAGSPTSGKGHTKGGKHAGRTAAGSKKTAGPSKTKRTSSSVSVSKSTHTAKTTPTTKPSRYGVPIRQIGCSSGFIVQLASELTPKAFAARVAELQRQGLVPDDAKAANSAKSCKLFTNQTNTLILYAGPFKDRYDACSDRLAGPYDAFIRGANPGTSGEFVSCICPARARDLPTISRVGATDQWIGELQRMLAAHLRYSIPDLGIGSWGTYTEGTRAAVQRFQSDNGRHGSGTVDAGTWRALQHAGC